MPPENPGAATTAQYALSREESSRLAAIVESASDAIIGKDIDGVITSWNPSAERIFGYPAADAIGQHISILIPPALQVEEDDIMRRIHHGERVESYESRRLRRDGALIDVRLTVSPVRDSTGEITGASKIVTDITDMRRSERQFAQLLETAPDAMVIANAGGEIWLLNSQAEIMFGYKAAELIGRPVEQLMPQRFRGGHPRHRQDYVSTPRVRPMGSGLELFGLRKDGSEFPIELSLSPLETDAGILVSTAIRDISERKKAEQMLRESLNDKEVLLKEVHHRVKNNLAVIGSLFYLQSSQMTDPAMIAMMRDSQDRVRSMAMVHESLYKSEGLSDIDFAQYASELCETLVSNYSLDGRVTLETDLEPVFLTIDIAVPCGLILNEIVTNAFKHAFPDGRPGRVRLVVRPAGPAAATVEVQDDGVGLPDDLDLASHSSLGVRLIRSLTRQVDGEFAFLPADPGTVARLTFPLTQKTEG